ncbi:amidohydrolase [Flavihumibacter cheonanensis]|uniref:amidohydrolase n=1 Tax=Flavihumibacter cheonanensis TaxID=1442385 RepID=UPI001EF90D46|nr:amidohydrolase [Flavihumibacter cheonanensis]MCG7752022.1 amidohydrolase [Flavihumibacter cheonanensis]
MQQVSRKTFIKNASGLIAGLAIPGSEQLPGLSSNELSDEVSSSFVLKNVRLETGYILEQGAVTGTSTDLFSVEIEQGKIKRITKNQVGSKSLDAKGLLMLPSFKDMHIHLDKTFYGGPWQPRVIKNRTVKDMIAMEEKILPEMLKTSTYKAEKMIELLQSKGTAFARSHVNIEPTSQLQSLRNLQTALENKKLGFGAELVAFPQHGLYYRDSTSLMKEAAQAGIDFIGGLDPASIDGNINRTMDFTVQLALDYKKGIDIHLHEGGADGLQVVNYLIDRVNENPVLKNRTWLSHAFVLASLESSQQEAIAEKLAAAGIGIASSIPMGRLQMPIPTLLKHGVQVVTGNDSIVDHWNSFGTGSVLQKANLAAQLYGMVTELELSQSLGLATAGITPLNRKGEQQWPKAGLEASFVLVDASCSAEAVARVSTVNALFHKGNKVFN